MSRAIMKLSKLCIALEKLVQNGGGGATSSSDDETYGFDNVDLEYAEAKEDVLDTLAVLKNNNDFNQIIPGDEIKDGGGGPPLSFEASLNHLSKAIEVRMNLEKSLGSTSPVNGDDVFAPIPKKDTSSITQNRSGEILSDRIGLLEQLVDKLSML